MREGKKNIWAALALALAAACGGAGAARAAGSPFATRVLAYDPAPGQNVRSAAYNDPVRALGAPVGGGLYAPENSKVVTLGGFGGSIVLGFAAPILNLAASAANVAGVDFIVYGNAFYLDEYGGRAFAEAGVIEVSRDDNHNGLADDAWYLIAGSHLQSAAWPLARVVKVWDDDTTSGAKGMYPPASAAWVPIGRAGVWTSAGFALPAVELSPPVMVRSAAGAAPGVWGSADCTPTLVLGDVDGDGVVDDAGVTAAEFYTRPSDPRAGTMSGVMPGSGGGDAIDISWAVDPATGAAANLDGIDFVRITTGVDAIVPFFGEVSCEVSGVARVVVMVARAVCDIGDDAGTPLAPYGPGGTGGAANNGVNEGDYNAFFNGFFSGGGWCDIADDAGVARGEPDAGPNNGVNEGDYNCFFNHFFL
ncbi:hypothetical protein BH11PLA1_BH11PLA1_09700 [soil metagenome]